MEGFYGGRPGSSFVIVARYPSVADMVTAFGKGAETVGIVNYGEYVIIDTINKNDSDNGKVYRRGFDYQAEDCGAEYIGQIVGPSGSASDLKLTYYNDSDISTGTQGEWSPASENGSLIPGKDGNTYNDSIQYKYLMIRDTNGALATYTVGFKIPYLVMDFEGELVEANYSESLIDRIDDESHPFYQKFKIHIPKGPRGDSIKNLRIYPKKAEAGTIIYSDIECTISAGELDVDSDVTFVNIKEVTGADIDTLTIKKGSTLKGYAKLDYDNLDPHLKELHIGYLQIVNYVDSETGTESLEDLGLYKTLGNVSVDLDESPNQNHYKFKVSYTDGTSEFVGDKVNFIDDIKVDESSNLLVKYTDPASLQEYIETEGYVNLGNIKGEQGKPGSFRTLCEYNLYEPGVTMPTDPPEIIGRSDEYKGWVITTKDAENAIPIILAWNYISTSTQPNIGLYELGTINSSAVNPINIIGIDYGALNANGVQLVTTVRKHV